MLAIRRAPFACRASSNPKEQSNNAKFTSQSDKNAKSKAIFQNFQKKRSDSIKKSANELVAISQKEIAEVNTFLKELDTFHREQFEEIKSALKDRKHRHDASKPDEPTEAVDAVEADAVVDGEVVEGENIFLKKE